LRRYESPSFRDDIALIWRDVKPLYTELHAYVRFKLSKVFPQVDANKSIPAHLLGSTFNTFRIDLKRSFSIYKIIMYTYCSLGNQWSQTWEHIYKYVAPYPNAPVSLDITPELQKVLTN